VQDEPGIKDAAKACELLHDLMVNALELRKPGQQIFYRLDGALPSTPNPQPHPYSDQPYSDPPLSPSSPQP
jgi:hypothetical protein